MSRLFDHSHHVAAELLAESRWEARDAIARYSKDKAVELLLAHAAEFALSPRGCDQLKSVALSGAVRDIGLGRTPLPDPPTIFLSYDDEKKLMRSAVHDEVSKSVAVHWQGAADVAAECANSMILVTDCVTSVAPVSTLLSPGILSLQKNLWDHPSIPANIETRLKMLFLLSPMQARLGRPCSKATTPVPGRWPFSYFYRLKQQALR